MEPLRYKPLAFWLLDDTIPFQDYSGYSASGTASSQPTTGLALSSQAIYSSVFTNTIQGQFTSPVFNAGDEKKDFSLEASFLSGMKTSGQPAQTYRENLFLNPSMETIGGNASLDWCAITSTGALVSQIISGNSAIQISGGTAGSSRLERSVEFLSAGTYTYSFFYKVTATSGIAPSSPFPQVTRVDDGSTLATSSGANPVTTATLNQVYRASITFDVPDTGAPLNIRFRMYTGGYTVVFDGALLEKTSTLNGYFDGSMPGYEWAGTANNSVSRTRKDIARINWVDNGNGVSYNTNANNLGVRNTYWTSFFAYTTGTGSGLPSPLPSGYYRSTATSVQNGGFEIGPNPTNAVVSQPAGIRCQQGDVFTMGLHARGSASGSWSIGWSFRDAAGNMIGSSASKNFTQTAVNTWNQIEATTQPAPTGAYSFSWRFTQVGNRAIGDTIDATAVYTWRNVTTSMAYFDGSYAGSGWAGAANSTSSYLYASDLDQSVLSHTGKFDGLTINGTVVSFTTKYTNGTEARASYDTQINKKIHAIGVHTLSKNILYVNGELVAEADIDYTQQIATFDAPSNVLYAGQTTGARSLVMNNVALYPRALLKEEVARIYAQNNRQALGVIPKQFAGEDVSVGLGARVPSLDTGWFTNDDWSGAVMTNCVVEDDALSPQMDLGLTMAGTWQDAVNLYTAEVATPLNSLNMFWDGQNVKVEASTDGGTTWETVSKGVNLSSVPQGFDPTNKQLSVRITFVGGIASAYIDNLRVLAYTSNTATPPNERTRTYTNPAVTFDEQVPFDMKENWGVSLKGGGTLTIGAEQAANEAPMAVRTVEVWVRSLGSVSFSSNLTSATNTYSNGTAGLSTPVGEWTLLHFVNTGADITGSITISGDVQVGKVAVYPTALTATQVSQVVANYTGVSKTVQSASGTIAIAEPAAPALIYAHDWSIVTV